jgi:hypothetical protein
MFFEKFPIAYFNIDKVDKILVQDFLRAVKIDPILKENDMFYSIYDAKDGETPEIISHKAYKSTQYHWVIMLLNEKFDPWRDFPQTDIVIQAFTKDKYTDVNGVHHYIDGEGNIVDELHPEKIPVTNLEFERFENEKKRKIKILNKSILTEFVRQYENLVSV